MLLHSRHTVSSKAAIKLLLCWFIHMDAKRCACLIFTRQQQRSLPRNTLPTQSQKSNPANYQTAEWLNQSLPRSGLPIAQQSDVYSSIRSAPHPKVIYVWHNARLCLASRPLKPGHSDTSGNYTICDRSMRRAHQTSRHAALKCCWEKTTFGNILARPTLLACLNKWSLNEFWGLDPWPLDFLGHPKFLKDVFQR